MNNSVHFVGIAGAGLSAIAKVLHESGWRVSGSDAGTSPFAQSLAASGVTVYLGHRAEQIEGADRVVISSAIPADNVEVRAAVAAGIPVLKRADFLGQLMTGRTGVAIAGTHGKTTTTGLIAFVLDKAGFDPTFIVGGMLMDYGYNARAGQGPFVIEADEYDRMFLGLRPSVAVVTSVEHDHPDCYPTLADMQAAFREFTGLLPNDGLLVACARDAFARELAAERRAAGWPAVGYGFRREDDYRADSLQPNGAGGFDFLAVRGGETLGLVRTRLAGEHNVLNTLAALAVVAHLGVGFNDFRNAVADYRGAGRRFEVKGEAGGVTVIDDYAHHPTEIKATLAAARRRFSGHPIWAMFQPHTFTRTRTLMNEFAVSFADADHVLVTDIFAAREVNDQTVTAAQLVKRIQHPDVRHVPRLEDAVRILLDELEPGAVLVTLGAGDGDQVGIDVLRGLSGEAPGQ